MKALNPELESQVDALAELCCSVLDHRIEDWDAASKPLIQALVTGGYAGMSDSNLQTLEARILAKCRETAIHRRAEISGISGKIQKAFDRLVTWTTRLPNTLQD